jgi:sugar lactone lactonase YvrE
MTAQLRLLTDAIVFGESPRWHDGRLWFSDVHDYALKTVDLDGTVTRVAELPGRPAGMGFLPDGRLLIATALDRRLNWVSPTGEVTEACDLTGLATGTLNDMVVDGRGRAYVGDIGFDQRTGEAPRPGQVILFTEAGGARTAAPEVTFPNGCAVTADGAHYYVCETLAERVSRFAVAGDGRLVDREVFAQLDSPPDGLCLDDAGGVWIGQPLAGRYLRLAPDGSIDREIASPEPFAVTLVLGGPEGSTLFLSSADTDLPRLGRGDSRGRIDALEIDHRRAGWP